MKRTVAAGMCVVLLACASVSGLELPRHVAKPRCKPGIPGYDYKPSQVIPAPTITAVSLGKIDITPAPLPGQERRIATYAYQFREPRLQVDHCFLSRMAVTLHADGAYQISFRADQNPQPVNDLRSPLQPGERLETVLQTSQLKRNTFVVKFRAYTAAPIAQPAGAIPLATPAIIEFPTMEFVVERGQPASKLLSTCSEDVKKYFPLIDRVEVEFTYR